MAAHGRHRGSPTLPRHLAARQGGTCQPERQHHHIHNDHRQNHHHQHNHHLHNQFPSPYHHLVACPDDRHRQHWQTVQGSQPHGYQGRIKVNFTSTMEKLKKKHLQGGSRVFSFVSNFLLSSLVEIGKDHVTTKKNFWPYFTIFWDLGIFW